MSTPERELRRVEPTGEPRVDALIAAMICPTCRTIYNAEKANCSDPWHSDNRPARDWGEWTPGKGVERIRTEMPGVMPDLTEEDCAAADAVIAAASKPAPNPLAHLPAMLEDARAYCLARFNYEAGAYISEEARQQHIDNDARSTTTDTCFTMPWNAGYARGISEGRRQAAEAVRAQAPGTSVIEGGPDLMAWAAELAECPRCPAGVCSAHRPPGPWEPAEQPESRVRTGYQCAIGGEACPGHSSKWLMCDPATRTAGEVKIRPRMTDGCGPEHTYRGSCEYAGETDRG